MKSSICVLFLLVAAFCQPARAVNENDLLHGAAHIGSTFVINTVTFGALNKLAFDPAPSMIFSGGVALGIGLLYKRLEGASAADTERAMKLNLIGVILSDLTIYLFDLGHTHTQTPTDPEVTIAPQENGLTLSLKF